MVPLEVSISEPSLLGELMLALLRNGCVTRRLGRSSCLVVHIEATDAAEARRELDFFVAAWKLSHPGVSAATSAC
jgi:hypothetical protein